MVLGHSIDDTCKSIAKFSERDADTYQQFADMCENMLPAF